MEPWRLEHDPYTPEGEVEGARKFAEGARSSRGRGKRAVAYAVVAALLLPFVLQLVDLLR